MLPPQNRGLRPRAGDLTSINLPSALAWQSVTRKNVRRTDMRSIIAAALASVLLVLPATVNKAAAQSDLQVPQSIRLQHQQIIDRLAALTKKKGPVAAAAQKAMDVLKGHYAREEQFVLPPLGLLPRLAKGEVSKDMEPAIAMAEKTKAALPDLQKDHVEITSLMNELIEVGKKHRDQELVRLATWIANQSLNDVEVAHPTAIFIGNYLRERLTKG
jgi:hypothetical protein